MAVDLATHYLPVTLSSDLLFVPEWRSNAGLDVITDGVYGVAKLPVLLDCRQSPAVTSAARVALVRVAADIEAGHLRLRPGFKPVWVENPQAATPTPPAPGVKTEKASA